jgi:hypothetical protein
MNTMLIVRKQGIQLVGLSVVANFAPDDDYNNRTGKFGSHENSQVAIIDIRAMPGHLLFRLHHSASVGAWTSS